MSATPSLLVPVPGERGVASHPLPDVARRVLDAWDLFLELAQDVDVEAPSRLPGWRGREVLVHLGSWDAEPALRRLIAGARGVSLEDEGPAPTRDESNALLTRTYADADRDEILQALAAARQAAAELLAADDIEEIALRPTDSVLGRLPLLTVLHATAYELAVHALDLVPAGIPQPPPALLHAGLGSLVDVTGALAAGAGLRTTVTAGERAGDGECPDEQGTGWAFGTSDGDWTTTELTRTPEEWAGVEGPVQALLDVSAGRVAAPPLLLRREVRARHVGALMELAPLLEKVPGLPGGAALRAATPYIGGLSRLVRRIPGLG
jgi:uncharacterized protein (TIGR03083 family)